MNLTDPRFIVIALAATLIYAALITAAFVIVLGAYEEAQAEQ